jgi:hypothetical protein
MIDDLSFRDDGDRRDIRNFAPRLRNDDDGFTRRF